MRTTVTRIGVAVLTLSPVTSGRFHQNRRATRILRLDADQLHTVKTSLMRRCSRSLRLCATLFLVVGASTGIQAQPPTERFRGAALYTAPMPGITATTRGRDAFAIRATEQGLLTAVGEDVASKLRITLPNSFSLRVGAKLIEDLHPLCTNESVRDAQQCPRLLGTTQKDGPFDVTFGPAQPGMAPPGQFAYRAYLNDARHTDVHAICYYLMPGNRRTLCAVVFLHNGDEYKIDSPIVSDDTNLGLVRCAALRLTQIVWPDIKPFDDLCPSSN
jgi:hypothetical protein